MGTRVTFESEDVRLLFEGLNRLLAGKGYRRRGTTWYSDTRELIRVFSFDPGPLTWTHFAVGVYLHSLDKVEDPTVWDTIGPLNGSDQRLALPSLRPRRYSPTSDFRPQT